MLEPSSVPLLEFILVNSYSLIQHNLLRVVSLARCVDLSGCDRSLIAQLVGNERSLIPSDNVYDTGIGECKEDLLEPAIG